MKNGVNECPMCNGRVKIQRHDSNSNSYLNLDKETITQKELQIEEMAEYLKVRNLTHDYLLWSQNQ